MHLYGHYKYGGQCHAEIDGLYDAEHLISQLHGSKVHAFKCFKTLLQGGYNIRGWVVYVKTADLYKLRDDYRPPEKVKKPEVIYRGGRRKDMAIKVIKMRKEDHMEWEDIAIVEMFQERRFVLMDDAKMYNLHILAVYHSPGIIQWVGKYDSPAFHQRKKAFEAAVMKFVKFYPEQMCKEFFEYWSKDVLCGDTMLWETKWSLERRRADGTHDNMIEEYIDDWAVQHGYESQYQPINSNESES